MQLPIDVVRAIDAQATKWNVPVAHLAAVVEVESNGKIYGPGKLPMVLYEPHLFARKLKGESLEEALSFSFLFRNVSLRIASKVWNKKLYPASQEGRWAQIDQAQRHQVRHGDSDVAAFESASYGVGQVLGEWWDELGFPTFNEFFDTMKSGAEGQIEVMMRYIRVNDLMDELREGRWTAFARGYNGPAYAKNGYHTKMAEAAARHGGEAAETDGMLRLGAKGKRVRELQALLVRAGYQLKVDGDFGPSTKAALREFQKARGITVDGIAGPETQKALAKYRQGDGDKPGEQKPIEIKEVVEGAVVGTGGNVAIEAAKDAVEASKDDLINLGLNLPIIDYVVAGLGFVAAALAVAAIGYVAWGLIKSRMTKEA